MNWQTIQKQKKRLQRFLSQYARIFATLWQTDRSTILLIVFLDILSAASKIGVLGLIALVFSSFRNPKTLKLAGYTIELEANLNFLSMISLATMIILLLGALASFISVKLSRKLGRQIHYMKLQTCERILQSPPHTINIPDFLPAFGVNKLLTQGCMHTSLAAETLLRTIYPTILFTISFLTMIYFNPQFALLMVFLALLFLPIYIVTSMRIHANAGSFYGTAARQMGIAVSQYTSQFNNRYLDKEQPPHSILPDANPVMRDFMDKWDKNLLANNSMTFLVAVTSGILLPIIIFFLGYLTLQGNVTETVLITFIGTFFYIISASQSLLNYSTNLLRYLPQVQKLAKFISVNPEFQRPNKEEQSNQAQAENLPETLQVQLPSPQLPNSLRKLSIRPGERIGVYCPYQISKVNYEKVISPFVRGGVISNAAMSQVNFINANHTFGPGTVLDNLSGYQSDITAKYLSRIKRLLEQLDILDEISSLPDGLHTEMSRDIWQQFSASARSALRLFPFYLQSHPQIVFLDIGTVQSLNPNSLEAFFTPFQSAYIFICMHKKQYPEALLQTFILHDGSEILGVGNADWFDTTESLALSKNAADYADFETSLF